MAASHIGYGWTTRATWATRATRAAGILWRGKILHRAAIATAVTAFLLSPVQICPPAQAQSVPGLSTPAALPVPPVAQPATPVVAPAPTPLPAPGMTGPVAATSGPVAAATAAAAYQVADVPVDASAENAVKARAAALAQGQQKALQMLLQRMSGADPASLPQPSAAEVERMVLAVSPHDEKTSAVRYLARVDVTFMPQAVQALLQKANISFSAEPAKPLVLLPVWKLPSSGQALLWEDPNPWRAAWMARSRNGVVPLMVPLGDLSDLTAVDGEKARALNEEALKAIAARYRADDAVVAEAVQPAPGGPLQVTLRRSPSRHMEPITLSVPAVSGEDVTGQLVRAVEQAASQIDHGWKDAALAYAGPASSLAVEAGFDSLDAWVSLRHAIDQVPPVRSWTLVALTRTSATLGLEYGGTREQLDEALAQQGLALAAGGGTAPLKLRKM